jgi:hypothetical protein
MGHSDPIETVKVTHEEGNEGKKIGVKRGIGEFVGAKLLKRQGQLSALSYQLLAFLQAAEKSRFRIRASLFSAAC